VCVVVVTDAGIRIREGQSQPKVVMWQTIYRRTIPKKKNDSLSLIFASVLQTFFCSQEAQISDSE